MRAPSSGFTMIEVLVAMLVVGTGALAMVMLQLHALRDSRDHALHDAAAAMALELAELRAAYRAAAPGPEDPYLFAFDAAQSPPTTAGGCASPCDAEGFARAAVAEWSSRLARQLPGVRAMVCRDSRADAATDWRCDGDPAAPVIARLGWRHGNSVRIAAPASAPLLTMLIGR